MANHAPQPGCDLRMIITGDPKIKRFLNSGERQLIVGLCPICKIQKTEWKEMKDHVEECRRLHQHPLLMRTCYCPYCLKKHSDGYSMSSHVQSTHAVPLRTAADILTKKTGQIVPIDEILKQAGKGGRSGTGWPTKMLPEPFPFACSACDLCWPTAKGLVSHFIARERKLGGKGCGGHLHVSIKPGSRRMTEMKDNVACYRYDFAARITCPFCTDAFDEAYALSEHVTNKHGKWQTNMEKRITPSLENAPIKKYYFAPFSCSKCRTAYKTMKEWAAHVHERTLNGAPCNGELRVMKKVLKEDGVGAFLGNVPPQLLGINGGESQICAAQPIRVSQTNGTAVKPEPLDVSDSQETSHDETIPEDPSNAAAPSSATATTANSAAGDNPPEAIAAAAAAAGNAVVKDEPMDEDEEPSTSQQQSLQEHANGTSTQSNHQDDVPSTSSQDGQQQEEDEPEGPFDCDDCGAVFPDHNVFIEHMTVEHGYKLATEDQIARLEAGEQIAESSEPPAKRIKVEEEEPGPSTRYPPLVTLSNPSDSWFKCKNCGETCETAREFSAHALTCPSGQPGLPAMHTCGVCKKRNFGSAEEKNKHQKECANFQLAEAREKKFQESHPCRMCNKRMGNPYVLLHHFMDEHFDTMEKLRKHYLVASDLLPFRCDKCRVGFEDPRTLLNHFKMREEFGIPCFGNLHVHTYMQTLQMKEEYPEMGRMPVPVPRLNEAEEKEDEYDECPRDPQPSDDVDLTGKVQCPHCTEDWPRTQLKLHVKMEHPRLYFEYAKYFCKKCKGSVGYFCEWRYAEHYEKCKADSGGPAAPFDVRELVCAPHNDLPVLPSTVRHRLPPIPEGMGNELRICRYCKYSSQSAGGGKRRYPPEALRAHQKKEHPIEYFTDAPYQCQRCEEAGFYSHDHYTNHLMRCTGSASVVDQHNIFSITAAEIEQKTGRRRTETPCYRVLIDADRRRYGHLAAFNRPIKCAHCDHWASSLPTLVEHHTDDHSKRDDLTFLCGGCARVCYTIGELKEHLEEEREKGNSRCYDQGSLNGNGVFAPAPGQHWDVNRWVKDDRHPPLIPPRSGMAPKGGLSSNWRPPTAPMDLSTAMKFRNLARQEAMQKRHSFSLPRGPDQLLPIRPINIMSKSPLSGERNLFRQQQIVAAANMRQRGRTLEQQQALFSRRPDDFAYKRVAAQQRQHDFARVDFSTPLNLPEEPRTYSSRLLTNDGRRVTAIHTPTPPRASILYQPFSGTVKLGNHAGPSTRPAKIIGYPPSNSTRSPHKATSSFARPSILGSSSRTAFNPSSNNSVRIIRPASGSAIPYPRVIIEGPPTLQPAVSPSKVPKKEPKQEPDC